MKVVGETQKVILSAKNASEPLRKSKPQPPVVSGHLNSRHSSDKACFLKLTYMF